jgi:hypothetical protein
MLVSPFNKMSSLCCAIATQRLTALCHAIAAQLSAFLLSSMPMHPKQNLAAAARALSSPFRCQSYPVDAAPLLFLAFLRFAIPLPD